MDLMRLMRGALAKRLEWGLPSAGTDCFRLLSADAEGLAGVEVDVLAGHWVVGTRDVDWPQGMEAVARRLGARSVWWKRLSVREKGDLQWRAGERVLGERGDGSQKYGGEGLAAGRFVGRENGLKFGLDMAGGYSQGIFLDQRLNRAAVADWLAGCGAEGAQGDGLLRVLNCFAYTGGFSLAAARAGAVATTLDLAQPYLDWSKDNFALNGLDADAHFWVRGDAGDWLRRWRKAGRRFDGIVLDPPTFSRMGKRSWSVERDLGGLVQAAADVLAAGGWLFVSTNCRKLVRRDFERMVAGAANLDWSWPRMAPEFVGEDYLLQAWGRRVGG